MMKQLLFVLISMNLLACTVEQSKGTAKRTNFSKEEQNTLNIAREIIKNAYYTTLITLDQKGQPRARIMEAFAPEQDFEIWLATNPKSRKVAQINAQPRVTLHYFDKDNLGYVSLMGNAKIINDEKIKKTKWKDGWEKFYVNQRDAYMLIQFIPEYLEVISIPNGLTGDEKTWQPSVVRFY